MDRWLSRIRQVASRDDGQSIVEYGLILGLVVLAGILALAALGGNIFGWYTVIQDAVGSASGG